MISKKIITIYFFLFTLHPIFAEPINIPQDITNEKYYEYLSAVINDKAVIFNTLNLSPEQIQKYEQITNKYSVLYKNNLREILKENSKLQPDKNVLRKLEKEILKLSSEENEELKSILNKIQCAKYRQIKHLEFHDIKKEKHPKNYYKLNPQMQPFIIQKNTCKN